MQVVTKKRQGFTIVELLIVIVVIGILAAITLIAFNGVQQRANVASLQSDLESASKQLAIDIVNNSAYATNIGAAGDGKGLKASTGNTFTMYSVNNTVSPNTYCITEANNAASYMITNINTTPTVGSCSATTGLVSWLPFNGSPKDQTNNASPTSTGGSTTGLSMNGTVDGARVLTGATGGLVYPAVAFNGNSFSLSVWFKTAVATDQKIVTTGSGNHIIQLFVAGQVRVCISSCVLGTTNLSDNQWHHVLVEGDNTSIRAYVDGSSTPSATGPVNSAAIGGTIFVGQDGASTFIFNGSLDDLRIYNRALSVAEMQSIYVGGPQ